ncbi:hypothetical protein DM860_010850 [Cuscuta australis]|uniref:Transmembrane protein n=1 Tax=Cuscuta australis TaxID=267555 RepID=A0A328E3T7_9ASTE|nr:hypothetical protein DM860_010850 [Cuscuta australis]
MHRSGSVSRVWDDYVKYDSKNSPPTRSAPLSSETDKDVGTEFLTSYPHDDSPLSSATSKREKGGRSKLAENAVHFIPLVLFLCAFILWFLSNPDIEVPMSGEAVAARIEGLTIEGDVDSTQTAGNLPLEKTTDDIIGFTTTTRYNNNDHIN